MTLPRLGELSDRQVLNFSSEKSWGVKDPIRFKSLMDEARSLVSPGYYLGDNLFTWGRNNSLFEDGAFRDAWSRNILNDADQAIAWRRYVLATSAYNALPLPGDFVECGVYAGTGIKTVVDYLGGTDFPKTFWGYDTFDYNPVEGHVFAGQAQGFHAQIEARFSGYPQVRLIKGLIPDSFDQGMPEEIAYLHIDLNNAQGEIAALDRLFDSVVSGGVIILDDYEWSAYRRQKQAEDPWFERRGYRVIPLPTGQGMLVKR
jgi:O-methyltransferase